MTDYEALIRLLTESNVEFIIVGGAAATAHGSARLTEDLDIVYARSSENVARLVSALRPYQPYPRGAVPGLPFQWTERTIINGLNFTLITSIGAIDLFGELIGGGGFADLLPDCLELKLFGTSCLCLSLERLIQVKRAAGRPKDLEAIAELELLLAAQRPER
ncbi:MAG TPA: hypothetical protein VJ124_02530 [Pyrinomonadaceae bacterium]|nr:hypothetical protein [Pyrinomonadaceae bacterium]